MLKATVARERLRGWLVRHLDGPTDGLSPRRRAAVRQLRLWRFFGQQAQRDRLAVVAGHLTFKTLLGLIPLLVLFLMIVNFFWRGPEAGRDLQDALFQALNISALRLDVNGEKVDLAEKIGGLVAAAQVNLSAAAAVGIATLFVLAMSMLATIEGAMNAVWGVRTGRPLWRRAILFWVFLTLGPPAVAAAYATALWIQTSASVLPAWAQAAGGGALGLAATVFALYLLYTLLPSARVQPQAAFLGAAAAGTLWHLAAKEGFLWYVRESVGYGQMYGNLAVVPIFFLWLYVTWLIVLLGFELAFAVQHVDLAEPAGGAGGVSAGVRPAGAAGDFASPFRRRGPRSIIIREARVRPWAGQRRHIMDVVKYLKSNRVKFQLRHHPARFTAQEVAAAEHVTGEEVAKVVILKAGQRFVMAVLPATFVLKMDRVKAALKLDDARLATEEEIARLFPDCEIGAMSPFGAEYGLETWVEEHLAADEEILIPAGTHEDSVLLPWKDFERLAKPKVAGFAVHAE